MAEPAIEPPSAVTKSRIRVALVVLLATTLWSGAISLGAPPASSDVHDVGLSHRGLAGKRPLQRLFLDLRKKQRKKLEKQLRKIARAEAPADGAFASLDVELRSGEERSKGKIRVSAHSPTPSAEPRVRIRITDAPPMFGLRRFELAPLDRAPIQRRQLILDHMRSAGVLAPRSSFISVSLEDDDLGVMVIEESLSKELIEAQRRRDGALLRLGSPKAPGEGSAVGRSIQSVGTGRNSKSDARVTAFELARGLLRAFAQRKIPAEEVFDLQTMARFLALAELWREASLLDPANIRLYFNPLTQRIEPIAFLGAEPRATAPGEPIVLSSEWSDRLLRAPRLRDAFLAELRQLAARSETGELGSMLRAREQALGAALLAQGISMTPMDLTHLEARATQLPTQSQDALFGERRPLPAVAALPAPARNPIPSTTLDEVLAQHSFLSWSAETGTLRAAPGTWPVKGSLVLPEGVGLTLSAGTELQFPEDGLLLATGALTFRGTAEKPVVMAGRPSRLGRRTWMGVVVLRSPASHHWQHVEVRNTRGVSLDGWQLTGGVTIRKSDVRLEETNFVGNRSEDALNLVRSTFWLRNVSFEDTPSDALDSDFCTGRIFGGRLDSIGGDGIDVSGSSVEIEGTRFSNIRDKALSVGEGSHVVARNLSIEHSGTALAAKDASRAELADARLTNILHPALMAYVKKAEYGPGEIIARNLQTKDVPRLALAQLGSRIEIDGIEQESEALDTEALYRHGFMKK